MSRARTVVGLIPKLRDSNLGSLHPKPLKSTPQITAKGVVIESTRQRNKTFYIRLKFGENRKYLNWGVPKSCFLIPPILCHPDCEHSNPIPIASLSLPTKEESLARDTTTISKEIHRFNPRINGGFKLGEKQHHY